MKCDKCGTFINDVSVGCQNCINLNNSLESSAFISKINEKNDIVDEMVDNSFSVNNSNKSNKKKSIFIKIISIIVIIIVLFFLIYFLIFNKPIFVFKSSLNTFRSKILDDYKPLNINISVKSKSINNSLYDKFYMSSSIYENINDNLLFFDLDAKYEEDSFIKFNSLFDKQNAYIELENIFDKYISFSFDENIYANRDFINVVDCVIEKLDSSLKDDYFIKSKDVIYIDNIEKEVNTNTFILNNSNYDEIIKNMAFRLKYDDIFLNSFTVLSGKNIDDVIAMLNDIQLIESDEFEYKITLYTSGIDELVGINIINHENNLNIYFGDKSIKVYIVLDGIESSILDIEISDNIYNVKLYIKEFVYSFDIEINVIENYSFVKPDIDDVIRIEDLNENDKDNIINKISNNNDLIKLKNDYIDIINNIEELIGMYNNSKKNSFSYEIKYLIDESKKQFLNDSINNINQNIVYTNVSSIPGNLLNNKNSSTYYIKLDSYGNIIKLVYFDKNYCYDNERANVSFVTKDNIKIEDLLDHSSGDSYNGCES